MKKKILSVVGARPNFIKIAPLHAALAKYVDRIDHRICHTGQHFDRKMSDVFFNELQLPVPDYNLGISGGSHAQQTARIMIEFEKIIDDLKPDLVVVPGDVNSTLACSLVASKLGIRVAHIESGLRSFNRAMPEEINRIVTDSISDYLFVSEPSGMKNLEKEGVPSEKVFFVGNIMIDSLVKFLQRIKSTNQAQSMGLTRQDYILVTFHRPSNVDDPENLKELIQFLSRLAENEKVVFPIHPRTRINLEKFGLEKFISPKISIIEPLGYLSFLSLVNDARLIVTDSGGIQEECTYLGVQCLTARNDTERPVTIKEGTNHLGGTDFRNMDSLVKDILSNPKQGRIPEKWDGKTAERIAKILS